MPRALLWIGAFALAIAACGGGLRVIAGQPRAGTLKDVECELQGRETPTRPYLRVAIESSCTTDAPTRITVLMGSRILSTSDVKSGLKTGATNYLLSSSFEDPGKRARLTVEVFATCKSGETEHGSDQCQMP